MNTPMAIQPKRIAGRVENVKNITRVSKGLKTAEKTLAIGLNAWLNRKKGQSILREMKSVSKEISEK